MKKIFSLLMFVLTALLGLTAQAQVVFHTSDAPTKSGWGANTYWYYITLNGKVISSAVGDSNGLKIESSTEKSGEAAMWCVVGNATDGYRFYNKKTGHEKFLGLTNDAGSGSWDNYGASRASMCAATTTHSTTATGTNFVFQLLGSTEYYVKLKDADNRYLNDRGSYISYWSNAAALGNSGSTIKFYAVDYNSEYASALASAENLISNKNGLEPLTPSDQPFYATQENFTILRNALEAIAKPTTAEEATTAIEKINAAKATFIASENLPTVGSKVVFKNDYNGFYLSGSSVDVLATIGSNNEYRGYLYGIRTKSLNSVWILEKGSADKTYKLKNYATGLYVCGYPGSGLYGYTLDSKSGSDYLISSTGSLNGTCAIGGSLNVENWMQCNYGNAKVDFKQVYNGGYSWGAGRWRMTTATEEDLNMSMNLDDIEASGFNALPFITSDAAYVAAKEKFTAAPTAENYKVLYSIAKEKLSNAYLRFKSQKSGAKMYNMSCDGNRANSTETDTKEKTDISNIWQLKLSDNGTFKFYNVNHKKWLPALNDADHGGLSPEMKNAENEGAKYTIYYTPTAGFSFIDSNGKWMQVEGDGRINWWSYTQRQCTETTWEFSEAEDITVALNKNEVDGKSYASVYLPFSISSVNDGVKAYVAKQPGTNEVTFTETTNGVKAENGFLLISDNAALTATVNIGESNTESKMSGTLTNFDLTNADKSTYRVFGKNSNGEVGFFIPSGNLNEVKANRGYFTVSNGGALRLNFEDSVVSGIDAIAANQALHNAPIFDLSGRRVMNTVKGGLYIQNGRKFIVK